MITKDLSIIEDGIDIGGQVLRGTLVFVTSDNLGAHTCLGLVKNFSKTPYCCRVCKVNRDEMKTCCNELPSQLRKIDDYTAAIGIIENSTKVNYEQTKGVARYCVLNDLKYFHIIDSMAPDIMHDVNEGIAPLLLKHIFERWMEKKLN